MEENRVLKEQLGGKLPRLNDGQRRRLAAKAKILGRRALENPSWGYCRLRDAIGEYIAHYRAERAPQGLGNRRINPSSGRGGRCRLRRTTGRPSEVLPPRSLTNGCGQNGKVGGIGLS